MDIKELYIGKPVYLISKSGRVTESEIISISQSGNIGISVKNYDGYSCQFRYDLKEFTYKYSYNTSTSLHILYDETKVAEYKRELVLKELDNLKKQVEDAFDAVMKHRQMNYDILNTDDVNKWIDEFKRNNNW